MCFGDPSDDEAKKKSESIEQEISEDKRVLQNTVKLLLLGAGESGKSTLAKQMKIIHLNGFNHDELMNFVPIIYSNIVFCLKALCGAIYTLDNPKIELKPENYEIANRVLDEEYFTTPELTSEIISDVKTLWSDQGIKRALMRANEFQIFDSAEYYFENFERISQPDYVPNVQDVLRSRVKTAGIIETEFWVAKTKFNLVDVGGQRSERRKWMHCFQDVTAVIFCAAMSAYDQKLYEDETTNRMHEALKLFKDICNTKWFTETAIILFLNKKDLFEKKIQRQPLTVCFPEYTGKSNYDQASKYIEDQFLKQNENPRKLIYVHHTCATDTNNITVVFKAVQDILINKILDKMGV